MNTDDSPIAESHGDEPERVQKLQMPFHFSIWMLVVCVLLAFVDLAFLVEVIGEVLDVEFWPAFAISSGLGLVGIAFMMHLGYKEADQDHAISPSNYLVHYVLWFLMGLMIALARLFSAHILDLSQADDVRLVPIFGPDVRQEDLVFAPIMLLLYLITGIGAKEATRSLLLNPNFHGTFERSRQRRSESKQVKEQSKDEARQQVLEARQEAEQRKKLLMLEREERRREKRDTVKKQTEVANAEQEANRIRQQEAASLEAQRQAEDQERERAKAHARADDLDRRAPYYDSVQRYKQLEGTFRQDYQEVSNLLAEIEKIEAEVTALNKAHSNTVAAIEKSESSAQKLAAFEIAAKTGASSAELQAIIAAHNARAEQEDNEQS